MAKIFLSSSDKDKVFAIKLKQSLSKLGADIWTYLDDIPADMEWNRAIQEALDTCEVMLLIVTPESMQSDKVTDEWNYFLEEGKKLILIRLKETNIPHFRLRTRQYIEFWEQDFNTAFARLHSELRRQGVELQDISPSDATIADTSPLPEEPLPVAPIPPNPWKRRLGWVVVFIIIPFLIEITGTWDSILALWNKSAQERTATAISEQFTQTAIAQVATATEATLNTPVTPTPNDVPLTDTQTAQDTAIQEAADNKTATQNVIATTNAESTQIASARTQSAEQTETQQAIADARITQNAQQTETSAAQTARANMTTTANAQATVNALQTSSARTQSALADAQSTIYAQQTEIAAIQQVQNQTATASAIIARNAQATRDSIATVNAQATANAAFALAESGVTQNSEWTPFIQVFNGVEMVLVPIGCFTIGPPQVFVGIGHDDERFGNEICFSEPFWIDRTEVSQSQFRQFNGVAANNSRFSGGNLPVQNITWFEARDFCELRNARLPTEAEWEYAAKGPDELNYPWGNTIVWESVVSGRGNSLGPIGVESMPLGASWVGALNMIGNVGEWMNSEYKDYPYDANDGRESEEDSGDILRVVRGGNWLGITHSNDRMGLEPRFGNLYNGFRCARSYE